jgi:hypothetical protein
MIPVISWRNVPGNKSMIKLHPLMLEQDGYTVKRRFSVGRGVEQRTVLVLYDSDYVYYRFQQLVEQLRFQDESQLERFIDTLAKKLHC